MNRLHFSAPLPVSETHCDPSTEISLSLFEDILNASLLTAATASIANRISSHHPLPPPLTALVSCLPPLPISYSAVMARRRTMPQEAETVAALREFVEGLTAARDFAQLVSLSGLRSRNSLPTGITILAADWRQVALLALILVDKLEATVGVEIPEPLTARAELAVGLLAAVCRGFIRAQ